MSAPALQISLRADARPADGYIRTFTGGRAWPLDARPEDINIIDIAHALSQLCRFTGHTQKFYSVAQHSVMVMQLCRRVTKSPLVLLHALLHDASEAYLCDVARPVKHQPGMKSYRDYEAGLTKVIESRFRLNAASCHPCIKEMDNLALAAELRDLMFGADQNWAVQANSHNVPTIRAWSSQVAKRAFLREFHKLARKVGLPC